MTLDESLPKEVFAGFPTQVFCAGTCSSGGRPVTDLSLLVAGRRRRPLASAMPREGAGAFLSGFWGIVPIETAPGTVAIEVEARLADGSLARSSLGSIEVVEPEPVPIHRTLAGSATPVIAICMATYDSDPALFRAQVESIRAQTDE
ncbi:MAG: hypothetical protein M3Y34_08000, partial [Actinomycetota bacterium]|nr:hypothetical protein [Actinomycetota bacterium]